MHARHAWTMGGGRAPNEDEEEESKTRNRFRSKSSFCLFFFRFQIPGSCSGKKES